MLSERLDSSALGPNEILLDAECSLLGAGVEVAVFAGRSPGLFQSGLFSGYPWRPGYAMVGRVAACGSNAVRLAEGERVLCLGRHASLQRYDASLRRANSFLIPVGEDLEPRLAVAARFLRVALAVMRALSVRNGDVVAVCGLGLMGNLTGQLLRMAGARVIGVSSSALRTRLACAVGIEAVTCRSPAECQQVIRELSSGLGVTAAVDAAGRPEVATLCASVCRARGRVLLLGTPRRPSSEDLRAFFDHVYRAELRVTGLYEWGEQLPMFPRDSRPSLWWDYVNALQLIRTGRVQVAPLLTDNISPRDLPAMYRELHDRRSDHLAVVVSWRG
jgi:threonine dehydrogenase-like Zn-dependent dehydrogenase